MDLEGNGDCFFSRSHHLYHKREVERVNIGEDIRSIRKQKEAAGKIQNVLIECEHRSEKVMKEAEIRILWAFLKYLVRTTVDEKKLKRACRIIERIGKRKEFLS